MYHGGIADQTCTLYAVVEIAPLADFWMVPPFPSPAKNGLFGDDCWKVDSNCILQHRHRGRCPFVGDGGPESLTELPRPPPYLTANKQVDVAIS